MSADPYLQQLAERGFEEADRPRFLAAWDRLEAEYLECLETTVAPFADWRDRFRAAATETVRLVEEHPDEAHFLVVDAMAAGELGRGRQHALGGRLREMVDTARAELPEPDRVPGVAATWIVAMFFDRIYRHCVASDSLDLSSQLPELMFLTVSTYFGTESGLEELIRPS